MATRPKALIIYWSATGNTEKVTNAIRKALEKEDATLSMMRAEAAGEEELYDYDLVFLGAPSYQFLPPRPVRDFIERKMRYHSQRGDIKLRAPKLPGKAAVVFCTYSGPHTGIDEAIPAGKYMGQFLAHIGFDLLAEWYVVGEFHGREEHSTKGRLGDIRGRPNQQDLAEIESRTLELVWRWRDAQARKAES
jgi:hypothetical protein